MRNSEYPGPMWRQVLPGRTGSSGTGEEGFILCKEIPVSLDDRIIETIIRSAGSVDVDAMTASFTGAVAGILTDYSHCTDAGSFVVHRSTGTVPSGPSSQPRRNPGPRIYTADVMNGR